MKKHDLTLTICEGAVFIAAALALSFLKIPVGVMFGGFGGSIDFVMIPLIVYAAKRGAGWGVAAGILFGTAKFFFAGGAAVNWQSMLLDYTLAYGAVGLGGLARGTKHPLLWGAVIGCLCRFAIHFISGVTIYAQYMPDEFLNLTMTSPWFYSLLYNGTYMSVNTALAIVLALLLEKPLHKFLTPQSAEA